MKKNRFLLTSALMLVALASCEKSLEVAGADEGNSTLNITTRSGGNDTKVSYPITVYAMNGEGQCVRRQQLLTASDQLSMKLQPMTYQIYAVGGAPDGDYTLPTLENASATSEVVLNEDAAQGDLMTAKNSVTMSDEENTNLTLSMSRKVMQLESIIIENVPTFVTGVSIDLAPIYSKVLLNGNYGEGTQTESLDLTEQEDGRTWQLDNPLYMLPSSGNATLTVKFTKSSGTTSYAYTAPVALEANKKIRIKGTFTGEDQLNLIGTITGAQWEGTTTIEFSFNKDGSTAGNSNTNSNSNQNDNNDNNDDEDNIEDENGIASGKCPTTDVIYKDCYVLNFIGDYENGYRYVTLVHKTEEDISGEEKTEEAVMAEINAALPSFNINGIKGWRLPTEDEIALIKQKMKAINSMLGSVSDSTPITTTNTYYYYINGSSLKTYNINSSQGTTNNPFTSGQHLRPVKTLKFKINP